MIRRPREMLPPDADIHHNIRLKIHLPHLAREVAADEGDNQSQVKAGRGVREEPSKLSQNHSADNDEP
jgi:hypothetical protein